MMIRDLNLKVEIFWNLNKTSHMSELNPCCGAIYVKSFRPSFEVVREGRIFQLIIGYMGFGCKTIKNRLASQEMSL